MKAQIKIFSVGVILICAFFFSACGCEEDQEHLECPIVPELSKSGAGDGSTATNQYTQALAPLAIPGTAVVATGAILFSLSSDPPSTSTGSNPSTETDLKIPGDGTDIVSVNIGGSGNSTSPTDPPQPDDSENTPSVCLPAPQPVAVVDPDPITSSVSTTLYGIPYAAEEYDIEEDLIYFWQIQPNTIQIQPNNSTRNPEITFTAAGDYTITFTVTDPCGLSGSDTLTLTVN